jgi:3-oxoacyl-[acyl-carrier-protein] synthase II
LGDVPVVGFKSHVGHTLGGAGAVELILSMMAMREQVVPPCANVVRDEVPFENLNVAVGDARPAKIRATLNTSLGFGGANTSIVLSAAGVPPARKRDARATEREVFITGVGVVLPGAIGNEALLARLENAIDAPAWDRPSPPRITDAELEGLLVARRVRRMSEYVKLQLAAATVACRDARIDDVGAFAETCSAILGTTHGSATYSADYYGQIVRDGLIAANPMLFAEGVPNAAAAQLSLMLGIKGACQTIIGTRTSGLDALNLAAARIATGAWDRAIVGAGEEHADIVHQAYQHCGLAVRECAGGSPPFAGERGFVYGGGGAVAMILESRESMERRQPTPRPRARVAAWSGARSRRERMPAALGRALDELGPVDSVLSSACGTWLDRAERCAIKRFKDTPMTATYGYVPELFSAGPLVGIAAVLLNGKLPRFIGNWSGAESVRAANGAEVIGSLAAVASDFTGCVASTRIEPL